MPFCANDFRFGPVSECRSFDFTLLLENAILATISNLVFLTMALWRLATVCKKERKITSFGAMDQGGKALTISKHLACVIWIGAALGALSSWMQDYENHWSMRLVFAAELLAAIIGTALCLVEHRVSRRPSLLLSAHLIVTLIIDPCRIRTFAISRSSGDFLPLFCLAYAARFVLFFLENVNKRSFLRDQHASTPQQAGGILSRSFLTYLNPVFLYGFRHEMDIKTLQNKAGADNSAKMYERFEAAWSRHQHRRFPLFRTLFASLLRELAGPLTPLFIELVASAARIGFISGMLIFAASSQVGADRAPIENGWGLVGAFVLILLVFSLAQTWWHVAAYRTAHILRGVLIQAIYRKALRLHAIEAEEVGTGAATSLISVDITRICEKLWISFFIVQLILQVFLGTGLLWIEIGPWCLLVWLSAVFAILAGPMLAPRLHRRQKVWSESTDKRVRFIASVLRHVKSIKIGAYEGDIMRKVAATRESEISGFVGFARSELLPKWLGSIGLGFSAGTAIAIVALQARLGGQAFDARKVFVVLAMVEMLGIPLFQISIQFGIATATITSLVRIQNFLLRTERQPQMTTERESSTSSLSEKDEKELVQREKAAGFQLEHASFGWREKAGLHHLTTSIPQGKLTIVVGEVGSGKTILLQSLLGDIDLLDGHFLGPTSSIAYCSQDAWLQGNLTIKENIVFASEPDSAWYEEVVKACALDVDFSLSKEGDAQLASGLSGGQKARIALARAVYSRAETCFLDDPLSALDAVTESLVFESLFGSSGLLRDKTVLLTTHAAHRLSSADHVLALGQGRITEQGTYVALLKQSGYVADLARILAETRNAGSAPTSKTASRAVSLKEGKEKLDKVEDELQADAMLREISDEMRSARWTGSIVSLYLRRAGLWPTLALFAHLPLHALTLWAIPPLLLRFWVRESSPLSLPTFAVYLTFYLSDWILVYPINNVLQSIIRCIIMPRAAGRELHANALSGLLSSPLKYFESNPQGRLLGRFSQDSYVTDREFSETLSATGTKTFATLIGAVLALVVLPYLLPVLLVASLLFAALNWFYQKSSRSLRRIDMSPLYQLFSQTVEPEGLRTIRAFQAQKLFIQSNSARLANSQAPWFVLRAAQKWFNLVLMLSIIVMGAGLISFAVVRRESIPPAALAIAVYGINMLLIELVYLFGFLTDLQIASVSIERVQHFATLVPEPDLHASPNAEAWRVNEGSISFNDISLRYVGSPNLALKGFTLHIKPGERIGICGRTGSGKSTTLAALTRLVDLESGSIEVDERDITSVSRTELRSSFTIVPQDPMLLEIPLRDNLDLEGVKTDGEIWSALEACHCRPFVDSLPEKLDTMITGDASAFSRGQRQLLALARALLRDRKILAMDEASSSLDLASDKAVQSTLRSTAFRSVTTLIIAHRTNTIRDCDRILVLGGGEIVELGTPAELLAKEDGAFRRLVDEQESRMST